MPGNSQYLEWEFEKLKKASEKFVSAETNAVTGMLRFSAGENAFILPKLAPANTAIIIGDSIAAAYWFPLMAALSGKLRVVRNAGIGGQTSSQMLARIDADVIAYSPAWAIIEGITPNDPGQGLSVAQTIANVQAMVAKCVAAGISPMICTGPPSDVAGNRAHMLSASIVIKEWANRYGFPVLDLYTPLADVTDGTFVAGYTADGTHPNGAGERAMADYVAARLPASIQAFNLLQVAANDPTTKVSNGLFLTDAGADGLADGWNKYGSGGTALSAISAGEGSGNWQVITPGGVGTQIEQWVTTTIGNVYEFSLRFFVTGAASARIRGFGGDFAGDYPAHGAIPTSAGAVAQRRFTATSASTQILLGANGASGTVGFGQVTVRDLTALGIA